MTLLFSTFLRHLSSVLQRRSLIPSQGTQVVGLFRLLQLAHYTRHACPSHQYRVPEFGLDEYRTLCRYPFALNFPFVSKSSNLSLLHSSFTLSRFFRSFVPSFLVLRSVSSLVPFVAVNTDSFVPLDANIPFDPRETTSELMYCSRARVLF